MFRPQHIKLFEAFESTKLSGIFKYMSQESRDQFMGDLKSLSDAMDFPVSEISDGDFKNYKFSTAVAIGKKTPKEATGASFEVNFPEAQYAKFWFNRDGQYLGLTITDGQILPLWVDPEIWHKPFGNNKIESEYRTFLKNMASFGSFRAKTPREKNFLDGADFGFVLDLKSVTKGLEKKRKDRKELKVEPEVEGQLKYVQKFLGIDLQTAGVEELENLLFQLVGGENCGYYCLSRSNQPFLSEFSDFIRKICLSGSKAVVGHKLDNWGKFAINDPNTIDILQKLRVELKLVEEYNENLEKYIQAEKANATKEISETRPNTLPVIKEFDSLNDRIRGILFKKPFHAYWDLEDFSYRVREIGANFSQKLFIKKIQVDSKEYAVPNFDPFSSGYSLGSITNPAKFCEYLKKLGQWFSQTIK